MKEEFHSKQGGNRWMVGMGGALFFAMIIGLSWMVPGTEARSRGLARSPARIVSLAPSVTEILFALGLEREIVGVTDFCNYPAEAREKPRVGGFRSKSLEAIVGLSPDLVVGTRDGNEEGQFRTLSRLGIRVLTVQPANLVEVIASVRTIGRATGRELAAEALARKLEAQLAGVRTRVRGAAPVRVLMVYGRDPLVLAGPGTFADDLIQYAGGANVAGNAVTPYPRFSMETVMAAAPEVIIEGAMGSEGVDERAQAARAFWSRFRSLPAVKADRIVAIDEDLIARPGPRIFNGLEALARALHPERFLSAPGVTP